MEQNNHYRSDRSRGQHRPSGSHGHSGSSHNSGTDRRRPERNLHTDRNLGLPKRDSVLEIPAVRTLLFYVLPFLLVNGLIFFLVTTKPSYEVSVSNNHDYRTVDVTFTITSHMPLKTVNLTLDSQPVDLVRSGKSSYTTTVDHNGVLEIYMENFNGMVASGFELVDVLDNETPDVTSYFMEDGILTLTVSDTQSGIDFDAICGVLPDSTQIAPLTIDKNTGTVTFPMNTDQLTVLIRDLSGNEYMPSFSVTNTTTAANLTDSEAISGGVNITLE